ncbi:ankyrin, partial [Aspergillus japonicus CBS 114.51]
RMALHYAAYCGSEQGIEFLLERGADVNALDSWGETALIIAARTTSTSCVELLLAHGAGI